MWLKRWVGVALEHQVKAVSTCLRGPKVDSCGSINGKRVWVDHVRMVVQL